MTLNFDEELIRSNVNNLWTKMLKNKIFQIFSDYFFFCIKVDIHTHKFYLHTQKKKEKDKIIIDKKKERTNDKIIIIH
jgi:hypothetical protein